MYGWGFFIPPIVVFMPFVVLLVVLIIGRFHPAK